MLLAKIAYLKIQLTNPEFPWPRAEAKFQVKPNSGVFCSLTNTAFAWGGNSLVPNTRRCTWVRV